VNTRLVTVRAAGRGFGPAGQRSSRSSRSTARSARWPRASPPVLDAGAVIVARDFGPACRCSLRASRKRGRRAARASARSGCARRGSGDRVDVPAGCGGCRSRRAALGPDREVMGLAPRLPFAGAPGAKERRKPGRGGESHEHASSDTGGGLLVIPRAERESGTRDRGREHSAMEGVLAQRRAVAFDEATAARVRRSDAMGTRSFPEGRDRVRGGSRRGTSEAASQARTAVDNAVAGRQSAEEPSIGALPGPRYAPHVGARGTAPGRARGTPSGARVVVAAKAEAGALPSSKGSVWLAHRECGQRGLPRISRRSAQAQGERALFASRSAEMRAQRGGAAGNTAVRRVLVKGVGCRSR